MALGFQVVTPSESRGPGGFPEAKSLPRTRSDIPGFRVRPGMSTWGYCNADIVKPGTAIPSTGVIQTVVRLPKAPKNALGRSKNKHPT